MDNPEDIQDYLPSGDNGAVLITSRNPEVQDGTAISGLKVAAFDAIEGRDFLLSMLPAVDASDDGEKKSAESLARVLGGLPLALKQIGSFMRGTGCGTEEMLEFLADKDQEKHILDDSTGFRGLGYNRTLSTAWQDSLSQLDKFTTSLLLFFAFMDPDSIDKHIVDVLRASVQIFPAIFPTGSNKMT